MYSRTRRKKRTASMEATAGEQDPDDDDDDHHNQLSKTKQQRDLSTTTATNNPTASPSLTNFAGKIELIVNLKFSFYAIRTATDRQHSPHRSSATYVAHLLHEADLTDLIHIEWSDQIKYFLNERAHLYHQVIIFHDCSLLFFS